MEGNASSLAVRILSVELHKQGAIIFFSTQAGLRYVVERCTDLNSGQWTAVSPAINGNSETAQVIDDAAPAGKNCFYRVMIAP